MAFLTVLNLLLGAALLPLAGGLILLAWGRRMGRGGRAAGAVGLALAVVSFGLALTALMRWYALDEFQHPTYVEVYAFHRVPFGPPPPPSSAPATAVSPDGEMEVPASTAATAIAPSEPQDGLYAGCLIDSLTVAMFFVVTLLNVLVHLFALGAPERHIDRGRFFAWLAWLQFALLGLVLANSLIQMLAFWELTSLTAFFLIRAATPETTAPRGRLRMYGMNAVGTAAFLVGLGFLVFYTNSAGALAFFDGRGNALLSEAVRLVAGPHGGNQPDWLTWAGICFIVAALARMAQFPFFTWLHEVSEAPAAAVALLTLATSTAGVLLLARLFPILTLDARLFLAMVGVVTIVAGAAAALAQFDMRHILAWLTVSQGGWILLFLGAGGYDAAILHLFTQAFFRTALFLAAAVVLRGLGTADLRQMGGLWKRFPITAFASLAAVFALGGAPWLSGIYATNFGLAAVYDYAHALQATQGRYVEVLLFYVPVACTYLTALAIGRWWWLAFAGVNRAPKLYEAAHESAFLTLPIALLAVFYAGVLYDFSGILSLISKSVPTVLRANSAAPLIWVGSGQAIKLVPRFTALSFLGLGVAAFIYLNGLALTTRMRRLPGLNGLEYWLRERFFFDELLEGVLLGLLRRLWAVLQWLGRVAARIVTGLLHLMGRTIVRVDREAAFPSPPPPPATDDSDSPEEPGGGRS
jgi:NADH-quinone oxidoreductase subunit L